MTNPTRQQIINAHEALEKVYERLPGTRYAKMAILAALPPKPQPTMAEVEWDDDKHYLAEAETESGVKVVMLSQNRDFIRCIQPPNAGDVVIGVPSEDLTPTGRRYTPTEVQE